MPRRIFIAVEISEDIRRAIYGQSRKAFSSYDRIRIIPPENIHITLKFLGNTRDQDIGKIIDATGEAVSSHESFDYSLEEKIGAFPNTQRARIAFIGIKKGDNNVKSLYKSIEDNLFNSGFERENKRFYPHITIARLKKPSEICSTLWDSSSLSHFEPCAESAAVIESILGRDGARYIIIKRFVLK